MTTALIFCHSDENVDKARELMESHQVSRIIVLDDNDGLAGIISLRDSPARRETGSYVGEDRGHMLIVSSRSDTFAFTIEADCN